MLSKTFLKKTIRAQKVHAQQHSFFLCSIIITELLSTSLKSELQFLPVSEMGKFHTLVLNFKDWPFAVIARRHFRPKLGHLNEGVYCKLINRNQKCYSLRNRAAFYDQPVLSYGSYWVLDKKEKHKCKKTLKMFSLKKQVLKISRKYQKVQFLIQ